MRGRRLPIDVESSPIPVPSERIEDLRFDDLASRETVRIEPVLEFAFRPERGDVRSGESDVLPKPPGGDKEVDERVTANDAG